MGEIAEIVRGGTPDTSNGEYWNGNINWFTPSEVVGNKYLIKSERTITKKGLNKSSARLLPKNKTLLFTSRASIGDLSFIKEDSTTNQGFQNLIINNADIDYVYSLQNKIRERAIKLASGSTFLEISKKEVEKLKLYFPKNEEQKEIGVLF